MGKNILLNRRQKFRVNMCVSIYTFATLIFAYLIDNIFFFFDVKSKIFDA